MNSSQNYTLVRSQSTLRGLVTSLLPWVAISLTGLTFVLVSLGGLVRNAGAGLSCPDWPLCFGQVIPPMNVQVFLEWFHRLIAGSVSVFLLALSLVVYIDSELRRRYGHFCTVALGLLAIQVVLGGLTVIGLLNPKWVTSHLAVGLAFFSTLLLLTLAILENARPRSLSRNTTSKFGFICAGLVYLQAILGGIVSSNYAGLACPDFPKCLGQWIPPLTGLVRLQFLHRLGALSVTLALILFIAVVFVQWSDRWQRRLTVRGKTAFFLVPVLLVVQVALGASSVWLQLPLLLSVAHLAIATALLGTLLVVTHELRRC